MASARAIASVLALIAAGGCNAAHSGAIALAEPSPVTLEVPAEPVPVRAAGRLALVYELHVTNAGSQPLRLVELRVLDAADTTRAPLAQLTRRELERDVKLIGARGAPAPRELGPGVRAVVFLWLALDTSRTLPTALVHRVTVARAREGGVFSLTAAHVAVRPATTLVLDPPVGAGDWWIGLGPSNSSEHRRAVIRVGEDTVPHLAQRFAIDWVLVDTAGEYARDRKGRRNVDWYGYGTPVLAAADGRVAAVVDGIPENVPGEGSRAVPMRVATVIGNYVLVDLGAASGARDSAGTLRHRYALYAHLQPGSLRVGVGDSVRRGQPLGAIGNSGNSDGPHLHFHVTEAADVATAALRAEGIPYELDAFVVINHDPELVAARASLSALGAHRRELPVEGDVLRVPAPRPAAP